MISKALILGALPLFCKLANVDAPDFYEFGIVFYSKIKQVVNTLDRFDIVSDCYFPNSVKVETRQGRGVEGTRVTNQ